jgi:hypothetical protein
MRRLMAATLCWLLASGASAQDEPRPVSVGELLGRSPEAVRERLTGVGATAPVSPVLQMREERGEVTIADVRGTLLGATQPGCSWRLIVGDDGAPANLVFAYRDGRLFAVSPARGARFDARLRLHLDPLDWTAERPGSLPYA